MLIIGGFAGGTTGALKLKAARAAEEKGSPTPQQAQVNRIMDRKGFTLIELLISLVISAFLIAGIHKTFITQQNVHTVQEQVVDVQQNVKVAADRMTREIETAGFGVSAGIFPFSVIGGSYSNAVNITDNANHVGVGDDEITIIGGAFEKFAKPQSAPEVPKLAAQGAQGTNTVTLRTGDGSDFDTVNKKYISIGGIETCIVTGVGGDTLTLASNLSRNYPVGTPVFKLMAISYYLDWDIDRPTVPVLRRRNNTNGENGQPPPIVAENIENLQFTSSGDGVQVIIRARADRADPDLAKVGDGYRRRELTTYICPRNAL